jgi:hypothetical protein
VSRHWEVHLADLVAGEQLANAAAVEREAEHDQAPGSANVTRPIAVAAARSSMPIAVIARRCGPARTTVAGDIPGHRWAGKDLRG